MSAAYGWQVSSVSQGLLNVPRGVSCTYVMERMYAVAVDTDLEGEAPVLGLSLLTLEGILSPHTLRVHKLRLPGLDVAVQVGNELVLLMAHAGSEVGHAKVGLLGVSQIGLGDQDVPHGQHAQPPNLLGRVEDDRREPGRHLGVEANLDSLQQQTSSVRIAQLKCTD